MSRVFVIADLHLGHKNIVAFSGALRGGVQTLEEHDEWIISQWNNVVTKHDLVWVLGDVAFTKEGLSKVSRLNGTKHLVLGNHDNFSLIEYQKYFNKVCGLLRYKRFWLSHAPIHEGSLRGICNIHGHLHSQSIADPRYICVSVEQLNGLPLLFDEVSMKAQAALEGKEDEQI